MRAVVATLVAAVAGMLAALGPAPPASAAVDDFPFSSFEADYTLGRDADGRSTLHTVERLTAEFPLTDQNHGIRRALVDTYQGAPTGLAVIGVTDGAGRPLRWESGRQDEFVLVTIAADGFVHGTHTYVITYEQRDVTLRPAGGGPDEFYWDVNGTGWAQPFARVTGRLHLPADIASARTGDAACYRGLAGSPDRCGIAAAPSAAETVLTASATGLGPGENVTLAVGFAPGTFVRRNDSLFASPAGYLLVVGAALLLASLGAALGFRARALRDAPGRPVIVPEYLPLAEPDLLVSSVLLRRRRRAVAATIVSLAVRRILRIVEEPRPARRDRYALELADLDGRPRLGSGPRGASPLERRLIVGLFGEPVPGGRVSLDPRDTRLSKAVYKVTRRLGQAAVAQGYRRMPPARARALISAAAVLAAAVTAVSALLLLGSALGGVLPLVALVLVAVGAAVPVLASKRPLTAEGAEVRDYLLGVREYLALAEADRMRVLQSPDGAPRTGTGSDGGRVVELYEQLLPAAVLFSVEKDWARVLGTWYEREGSGPDWYGGSPGFSAVTFSSGIAGFSATTAAAYPGSAASSSSGGSSGGGASGGGGGGGGGGGV